MNRIKRSLRIPSEYQKLIDRLDQLPRRRGRRRRRRLPEGGSSRSDSDHIVIAALEAGREEVQEICDYGRLEERTVYRSLERLEAQKLVASDGWPQKWHLIDDPLRIQDYEFRRLQGLKSARRYTLSDLRRDLELRKHLAEGGDETIERYILHHGSTEDFLAKEKEEEKERKKEKALARFVETERKKITYIGGRPTQKSYARIKRRH